MSSEPRWPEEATFERRLLESARADARPDEVGEAWARFAGKLGTLLSDPSRDRDVPGRRAAAPPTISASAAGSSVTWPIAVKWILLGAVAGSGLTAGLIGRDRPRLDKHVVENKAIPSVQRGQATSPTISLTKDVAATDMTSVPRPRKKKAGAAAHPADPSVVRSTLAEEVSRIDTAQIAISNGDPEEAINLIEQYHRAFPNGALANDADVVALEAAVAKRDRADVERRAQDFLSRYPRDPQAARVKSLGESLRER